MKHFVSIEGAYLGAWDEASLAGPAAPPAGSIEVPIAPDDARRPWLGDQWGAVPVSPAARRAELLTELAAIDAASARPLRAILVGSATDEDRARLTELDEQAAALRLELAALDAPAEPEVPPAEA